MIVGLAKIVILSFDSMAFLLAKARGCLVTYTLEAKLGAALYEVMCLVIICGMKKGGRVCGLSLRETMVQTIIIKKDVFKIR